MYILKNAWTAIIRNKGRNILIAIIILIVAASSAITLAINNSAVKLIDSYKEEYQIEATINVDRKSMMGNFDPNNKDTTFEKFDNIESLTIADIEEYANSKYVKSYYYTSTIGLNSNSLEKATEERENFKRPNVGDDTRTDFSLIGYSSYEAMEEFINGSYKITDGEASGAFTGSNCIINEELAILNEIKVGDTIALKGNSDYILTVTGIYNDAEETDGMTMFSNSVNTILTNATYINTLDEEIKQDPTFMLTSSDVVDIYEQELKDKGLNEYLSLSTNLEQVENSTKSIANVKTFAITFLIITLIIGSIVLFVVNLINVRERKYEIGVLRTIGMKKSALTIQFASELLIVSLVALLVGAGLGAILSVPISNKLLEQEIVASNETKTNISRNFDGAEKPEGEFMFDMNKMNGVRTISAFESIDAVVDINVLLELLIIGLSLTLISSLSSMISIQRFSPLAILKERS